MKQKITLFTLLLSCMVFAQIPAGYYSTATGTGYVLKTQLYNIIKGHTDRGYDGLYVTYGTSDRDVFTGTGYENDNSVYDIYTENPTGSTGECSFIYITDEDPGSGGTVECDSYNREHIIPQSIFSSNAPMVSDAHFIPPTDKHINGVRSNYPHGNVSSASFTSNNGSKLGSSAVSGYPNTVFEPNSAFKGDIARMYFYFVTRYENFVAGYSYGMFNNTSNQVFTDGFKAMLLAWHNADPVSVFETTRNNAIYARQGNRNPYIDHPEYVDLVWGCPADAIAPTAAAGLILTGTTSNSVSLSWTAATDNTGVAGYDIYVNGLYKATTGNTTYTVTGLTASTAYNFYVIAKDCQGNTSPNSNTANGTTTAGGTGTATDLFFSEYVEGSSTNKALEIINLTGTSVDLSIYSIKKQTNGAGLWSTGLTLSGTLTNNSVYLIASTTALVAPCIASRASDLTTTAGELSFNGNDPIGLFKSGTLIDMIGVLNVTSNFSADETLRRKSTVTSPNSTFNKAGEWEVLPVDTCGGLGDATLNTTTFSENEFKIYPNPSNGKFNIDFKDYGNYAIEIYSVIGQKVLTLEESNKQNIEINNLQQGVYLIKITKDSKSIVKKVVIN